VPICASCGRESEGDFRFCPYCAAPLETAEPAREQRKTVTVLFCDVTGSTALGESKDPEALRALLTRYFERMKGIVESHGGPVALSTRDVAESARTRDACEGHVAVAAL
jgi:adenylate/guanylate cyclase family protein